MWWREKVGVNDARWIRSKRKVGGMCHFETGYVICATGCNLTAQMWHECDRMCVRIDRMCVMCVSM